MIDPGLSAPISGYPNIPCAVASEPKLRFYMRYEIRYIEQGEVKNTAVRSIRLSYK